MPDASPQSVVALLRWYNEIGVDLALDDDPHDRFAELEVKSAAVARLAPQRHPPRSAPAHATPRAPAIPPSAISALSSEAVVLSAREAAERANNLEELRQVLDRFEGCAL